MSAVASAWQAAPAARCADCAHRDPDPGSVERAVAGLVVFSSGYGSSLADSRLCALHDRFVSPGDGCCAFDPKRSSRPA
ncbi:MAG TPA: hypothetical protein VHC91_24210 [Trinickia sp.]|jgi:hypothetical protein|uniref:hypothetical protein n=1 Tax=Trinickia sp. TaxID=2571163 RepID=UPI002CFC8FFB|nr:hypothetical protein [Trinickia sp.]HVW53474.1 hypothetical protein [Trinickia sp.]